MTGEDRKILDSWARDSSLSDEENDRRFMEFFKRNPLGPLPVYPDPMLPPWKACPDIPMFSIGWRMGGGEDYMDAFQKWLKGLSEDSRDNYIRNNPEPSDWKHWWVLMTEGFEAFKAAERQDR